MAIRYKSKEGEIRLKSLIDEKVQLCVLMLYSVRETREMEK